MAWADAGRAGRGGEMRVGGHGVKFNLNDGHTR